MSAPAAAERMLTPSVANALDVLAAEIELAGARCISLDRVLAEVMEGLSTVDRARLLHGMHGVDLLAQHLTSLSAFARTLSTAIPDEVTASVDAAISEITLGALAERIAEGLGVAAADAPDQPDDDGDVDLF